MEAPAEGPHRVSLVGLDDAARSSLADPAARARALVVRTEPERPGAPGVAGTYALDDEGLHFRPLFRFAADVSYVAHGTAGGERFQRTFTAEAAAPRDPPRVVAFHPAGGVLPANALRAYVQFSRPMATRDTARRVRLVGADGSEVPLAFVEIGEGLWDPGRTRLTLFFHPGRVKRGVAPGERLGPPLVDGRSYRFEVDAAMSDAEGQPMGAPFAHPFRAGPADRDPPRAEAVEVVPPSADGRLTVRLPEPLDRALLQRFVWVEDASGGRVAGAATVDDGDAVWTFRPEAPWPPGAYAVRVGTALEDRAGNRFDRPFDRAAGADVPSAGALRFPFVVP
ncbi:MAG: Ig-like domain-containing protein [Vicinamibacteria bacterium]